MDYTPGIVSLTGRGNTPIPSTMARQLALYVVLYSPIAMAADLPENYAAHPRPFEFIKQVPTDWTDTRMVAGAVGDYAAFARKDRHSAEWYLGAITDENGRSIEATLDFLEPGRTYEAQFYHDGEGADFRTESRDQIIYETRRVKRGDVMALKLAPGGGAAVRFVALGK